MPNDDVPQRDAEPPAHDTAGGAARPARRMMLDPGGPALVEGPVEVELPDGTVARSDRFMVAVCMCRRSRTYPWCDTSHRRRTRARPGARSTAPGEPGERDAPEEGPAAGRGRG